MATLVNTDTDTDTEQLIWRHARWFEPHPAQPVGVDHGQPSASLRVSDECQTCREVLVAYCPDCLVGEPHACPHLITKSH